MIITQGTLALGSSADEGQPIQIPRRQIQNKVYSITLFGAAIPSVDGTYTWDNATTIYNHRVYYKGANFIYWDPLGGGAWAVVDILADGVTYTSKNLIGEWSPSFEGFPPNPVVADIIYS